MTQAEIIQRYVELCHTALLEDNRVLDLLNKAGIQDSFLLESFSLGYANGRILESVGENEEIIQKMVHEFWQVMTPDVQHEIKQRGFTIHEVVTLASIIEKEVRVGEERELISAVYNNRLRIKMKLDSDPTVIYGLQNFDGNLTKADLQKDTPYNTYKRRGLPPGPIANPGEASILAAIHPAEVKYLYFVSRNDGTHEFSNNYNDHLRAVRKYQRNRKKSGS